MFFKFIRVIAKILAFLLYRVEASGMEHLPENGAYIVCANHIHAFDPVALTTLIKRQPRFMGKKELFENFFLGAFFRALGAYPVDRNSTDLQAYRKTMDILKDGHGLMIFSQGTRMEGFENAKSGVALFALKSGAPIIPVGISGSYKLWSTVSVKFGEPIPMTPYEGKKVKTELVDEVMSIVTKRIVALTK